MHVRGSLITDKFLNTLYMWFSLIRIFTMVSQLPRLLAPWHHHSAPCFCYTSGQHLGLMRSSPTKAPFFWWDHHLSTIHPTIWEEVFGFWILPFPTSGATQALNNAQSHGRQHTPWVPALVAGAWLLDCQQIPFFSGEIPEKCRVNRSYYHGRQHTPWGSCLSSWCLTAWLSANTFFLRGNPRKMQGK